MMVTAMWQLLQLKVLVMNQMYELMMKEKRKIKMGMLLEWLMKPKKLCKLKLNLHM